MISSSLYPLFMNLSGKGVLVVGCGEVGARKIRGLLQTDVARIDALDIRELADLDADTRELLADPRIVFLSRGCLPVDIKHRSLVFAATSSGETNSQIAAWCHQFNVPCNLATNPEQGDFVLPSVARCGSLAIALSTGGASPMLARKWRKELETWLCERENLARFMGRVRELLASYFSDSRKTKGIYSALLGSSLPASLAAGDLEACRKTGLDILPACLHEGFRKIIEEYESLTF